MNDQIAKSVSGNVGLPLLPAFLAMLAWIGAAATISAQTPDRSLRVGLIAFGEAGLRTNLDQAVIDGLRSRGYIEGKNLIFERRYAGGKADRVTQIANELASMKLDAIMTTCTPTTRAMQKATQDTPLVMAAVSDPLGQGLIASYARPGGNITGLASQFEDVTAKMLELLAEVIPRQSHVAVIHNPRNPVHDKFLKQMSTAAGALGIELLSTAIGQTDEVPAAFDGIAVRRAAAVIVLPDDSFLNNIRRPLVEAANARRLASFFGQREAVDDGGMMSYGENMSVSYARAGYFLGKIKEGVKPADLAVEQPTKFELVVNLKTARALGLTIPPSILIRADEVIE